MGTRAMRIISLFEAPGRIAALLSMIPGAMLQPAIVVAHDFWIEPDRFHGDSGDAVLLTLRQGVGLKGDSLPYITEFFVDFSRTDATGRHPFDSEPGDDPAASFVPADGETVVGYFSNRDFVELEPEKFRAYLLDEGMDSIEAERERLGEADSTAREYFVRCAKTLLRAGPVTPGRLFDQPLGFPLELVPLDDPGLLQPGDTLRVRLLYEGKPIEGIRVRAFTKDRPREPLDVRTDSAGSVQLLLPGGGIWFIKAVHMRRLEDDPNADWESFWASLLFEIDQKL